MRKTLPTILLSASFALAGFSQAQTQAQPQRDRFAYAITDLTQEGAGWNVLRKLDLQTGAYSDVLLDGTNQNLVAFDASSKRELKPTDDPVYGKVLHAPFSTGVAAVAYDAPHNRLYFTPMFVDQLRYIDLETMKVYFVSDQTFSNVGNMKNDEAKIITRMVIAPDGYGYAISNDGSIFVRFTTGKKTRIEQLGSLIDDATNGDISIHTRETSFGGDMVSDENGDLYILSAPNHIFKINTQTRVATHIGSIKNLPAEYTVNGAVANEEGKLLVSSAVDGSSYFIVDPMSWEASPFTGANGVYKSSDLANSNFLAISKDEKPKAVEVVKPLEKLAQQISVYPNPITNYQASVQFSKVPSGDYTIELTDMLGRRVQQQRITINAEQQTQNISISSKLTKGNYLVKVFDRDNQSVFTQKVLVQ